jgi:1,4-dihydroxy-2-naphthoate polyprenyltransferase
MALRPKTLTAAWVPVMVATSLVKAEGFQIIWWISVCALLSSLFIQIGTNFVNDALDFKKGADDHRRTGPKRVTQSGLLTHKQVMGAAGVCFLVAIFLGIPLVLQGGLPIVAIGLVSVFCGYAYTGGPYPLAYKGLGDLFVVVFFGLVAVLGTFYLHTGTVTDAGWITGLQIGLLATVLIAVNNFRDSPLDKEVGKKTLVVRFGAEFAKVEILLLTFVPFLVGFYWLKHNYVMAGSLPLFALPLAMLINRGVQTNQPGPIFNKFLAMGAALHLLFGILLTIGLALK